MSNEAEFETDRAEQPPPPLNAIIKRPPRGPLVRVMASGAIAFGAVALGALAIGALAIGTLAVGRLVIGRARIRTLEIDNLIIRRVGEKS